MRPGDVARLLRELGEEGATPYTLLAVRRTLRAAFGVAAKMEPCEGSPVTRTFSPKIVRRRKVHFGPEEARARAVPRRSRARPRAGSSSSCRYGWCAR